MNKPFSQACENNKKPILDVLRNCFDTNANVLEIGSGTGQHAVYFAEHLPQITWQTSDRQENIQGIECWVKEANLPNVKMPVCFDVADNVWPCEKVDAVFSANTAHIMAWHEVELMFSGVGTILKEGGCFALYGPFNQNEKFTSESNAQFDDWLKARGSHMGIRDFDVVNALALTHALELKIDSEMPANNRLLTWKKVASILAD